MMRAFRPYVAPRGRRCSAVTLVVAVGLHALAGAHGPGRQRHRRPRSARNSCRVGVGHAAAVADSSSPASSVLGDFIQDFDQIFAGLHAVLPVCRRRSSIVLFRRRPLVWLISSSTMAYLRGDDVPLLAIPYIYLTYFEILHIPVRNVIFFVYLLAGALALRHRRCAGARRPHAAVAAVWQARSAELLALLATLTLNRSRHGLFRRR